jgi:hypothetical protein
MSRPLAPALYCFAAGWLLRASLDYFVHGDVPVLGFLCVAGGLCFLLRAFMSAREIAGGAR